MQFRARCTNIVDECRKMYQPSECCFLRDASDIYIEVSSEREAELIEAWNKEASCS